MFSNELVLQILDYLDDNLYKKVTISELSFRFHYNKDYIMRLFKREIGCSIIDYMNQKRIYLSLNAFQYHNSSILSISLNFGFYSLEYYSEVFRKIIGVSPSTYLKFKMVSRNISLDEIYKIQDSLSNLDFQFRKIEDYRHNIKSRNAQKILSIFK